MVTSFFTPSLQQFTKRTCRFKTPLDAGCVCVMSCSHELLHASSIDAHIIPTRSTTTGTRRKHAMCLI